MRLLGKINLSCLIILVFTNTAYTQFTVSGEFRPRTEYLHGYKTLAVKDMNAPFFTSQRTRLNLDYKSKGYNFYLSLQDVRVWGSGEQIVTTKGDITSLHQAYAHIFFGKGFSLKAGRQHINLDDGRIVGLGNWSQYGKNHDAFVFKYIKNETKADLGITFNINKNASNYHVLQYVWLHNDFSKFSSSFLLLNNGTKNGEEIQYSQTIGTRSGFKEGNFSAFVNAYIQTGKMYNKRDINANLLGLDIAYKAFDETKLGLGYERQSGNDFADMSDENNAFTSFYGANHKFNGHMDYFYVGGNHLNSVGLQDIFLNVRQKFGKVDVKAMYHYFMTAADFSTNLDSALGSEIDLSLKFPLAEGVSCSIGYSHMFPTETLKILKDATTIDATNNWAWLMILAKPTMFASENKE
jgi:hypothetical protein